MAYAVPTIGVLCLWGPISMVQGIYAKYFGLSLSVIASIILIARLFDAISDPIIGKVTDNYYLRKGTRKPFIRVGGMLLIVSAYFLYVPVDFLYQASKEIYFLCSFIAFYLGYTLIEILINPGGQSSALQVKQEIRYFPGAQ